MSANGNERLRRVGALWKPRDGARSLGSGSLTIAGQRQRFVVLPNRYKTRDGQPDYVLMSSDEPEANDYAGRSQGAEDGPF